jgi:phosphatidylserine/phosphatidylglycerophosphate/cardiolipin synthase-like enzyme
MQMLEGLLLATGFSGALTLGWLARLVWARFRPPLFAYVHFSPHGGCTEVVVRELGLARREILLLAYGFTSRPIAQALVEAKLRGVHVEVILDHSNEGDPHSEMPHLVEQGLVPLIDDHHAIAHNKVVIIDGKIVITGSFNFTQHAETSNAENLLVLRHHHELATAYRKDYAAHRDHARAVGGAKVIAPAQVSHDRHASPHSHDALDAVARSVVGVGEEEKAPRTTPAASDVLAKLRKQMADATDEGDLKKRKAA